MNAKVSNNCHNKKIAENLKKTQSKIIQKNPIYIKFLNMNLVRNVKRARSQQKR